MRRLSIRCLVSGRVTGSEPPSNAVRCAAIAACHYSPSVALIHGDDDGLRNERGRSLAVGPMRDAVWQTLRPMQRNRRLHGPPIPITGNRPLIRSIGSPSAPRKTQKVVLLSAVRPRPDVFDAVFDIGGDFGSNPADVNEIRLSTTVDVVRAFLAGGVEGRSADVGDRFMITARMRLGD